MLLVNRNIWTISEFSHLTSVMPALADFPLVPIHVGDRYVEDV